MADHGTCSGCGADTDPDEHCCGACAEEHDAAVRAIEREECAQLVERSGVPAARAIAAAIRARGEEVPRG